ASIDFNERAMSGKGSVVPDYSEVNWGHAVVIAGYRWDNGTRQFRIHNSWSKDWKDRGYAWISDSMIRKFTRELATLEVATADAPPVGPPPPGETKVIPTMSKNVTREDLEARKKMLTPEQYRVTQQEGTEPPFRNAFWDNHEPGIYVDVVSGEPLFSSKEKFDSGTGWPSFTRPLEPENVSTRTDSKLFMRRTEVR